MRARGFPHLAAAEVQGDAPKPARNLELEEAFAEADRLLAQITSLSSSQASPAAQGGRSRQTPRRHGLHGLIKQRATSRRWPLVIVGHAHPSFATGSFARFDAPALVDGPQISGVCGTPSRPMGQPGTFV
jgi:hypothetical protein